MHLDEAIEREAKLILLSSDAFEAQLIERLHGEKMPGVKIQAMYYTMGETPFWFNERDQ